MGVVMGAHPGGRRKFAVSALFYAESLPALMFRSQAYSGTDEVLTDIIGTYGEWGELAAVAIDAPLTWSGAPGGWRPCDLEMRDALPAWSPKSWIRAPSTVAGAVGVQGPALAWRLAQEVNNELLPSHRIVETHPRLGLARIAPDLRSAILGYREVKRKAADRRGDIESILTRMTETGLIRLEAEPPSTSAELEALICALVALAIAYPESGLVVQHLPGGEICPVGEHAVSLLCRVP